MQSKCFEVPMLSQQFSGCSRGDNLSNSCPRGTAQGEALAEEERASERFARGGGGSSKRLRSELQEHIKMRTGDESAKGPTKPAAEECSGSQRASAVMSGSGGRGGGGHEATDPWGRWGDVSGGQPQQGHVFEKRGQQE